ncbi:pre-rRNA-processing protein TSR1 homolog isoform X1 [Neodiprion pinetum]|uniref:pre-rRNA-processing protein TSR1 homolog isoform X1 n=1 Tax=Neodiprion pinetum TaxID=441929 RepID=UPI001EDCB5AA|nr:pre-rRNA-processing protein TSR1 homolog [Neodiprion pinetum]XP_046483839.1 pre-rRNA-processing protein TSR1 homolog [Neodiprion pinetum]XP_046483840.1 pre-rRNA-processing protein TSR1 homolog [Neodiprion pinetum]
MGINKQERHRSGAFKQSNKVHKTGRHRSKGSIESEVKGKVEVKALSKRVRRELRKEERKNQAHQIRQKKRDQAFAQKRNLGGYLKPPLLVTVIPLNEDVDVQSTLSLIAGADQDAIVTKSPSGATHVSVPRYKQRFSFIVPPLGNTFATLDTAKVADTILFVVPTLPKSQQSDQAWKAIDDWGEEILAASIAQGLPTTVVTIVDLETLHPKKRQDVKQQVQKSIFKWLPNEKVMPLDKKVDALNVLRRVGSQKQKTVSYRDNRSHLFAEHVVFKSNNNSDAFNNYGTLEVTGYLRGMPLSVNGLVHIPGLGEFQMSKIEAPEDPYPLETRGIKGIPLTNDVKMKKDCISRVLERVDPNLQESLQSENIPDPLDAEQTWPTNEELADAEAEKMRKKIVKRVPKGTSVYQAAWIPDIDGEEADEISDSEYEDNDEMAVDADDSAQLSEDSEEEAEDYETMTVTDVAPDEQRYDQDMDMQEEQRSIMKIKEARMDAQFPDERDTPQDIPAKEYFQKYRGLESFRTSLWDPKENLPADYARIYQFENFDRTRKRIMKESVDRVGAMPGWYITVHVTGLSEDLYKAYNMVEEQPLIIFGLLPHEHKMSVLNVVLKRTADDVNAIKSKEKLVFQCGFRRFTTSPIFSQHTSGNKHKYERYFQPNSTVVASMYAPITFSPCPVMCYLQQNDGSLKLVATGSVLSANPDRIIVKRVVLSGYPFKVHKRSAVVRFMFFNRDDINWFRPVQLHTKHGRRGHIKEPLGTHGHMKCVFNGQLKSQDTILMNLYKRVFPKWTYDPYLLTATSYPVDDVQME